MAADVDNALDWEALDCTDLLDPDLRDPADPPPPPPPMKLPIWKVRHRLAKITTEATFVNATVEIVAL